MAGSARIFLPLILLCTPVFAQSTLPAPIPSAALQSRARELIHKLFVKDYAKAAAADRLALAKLLISQGKETRDDPAARYVALTEAADLAASAGEAPTALVALADLASLYSVNLLEFQRQALARAHNAASTPAQSEAVMRSALNVAQSAAQNDAFDAATALADLAESAANKTRQVRVVTSIQVELANLRSLASEFLRVKAAFARLDSPKQPENPSPAGAAEDHLTIGLFYALHKGQWSIGLPHLAQGSDDTLRALAQKELAPSTSDSAQLELADAWWNYAQTAPGEARPNATLHAQALYKGAQATLQGITLTRIAARINEPALASAATIPPRATGPSINLLSLLDANKDKGQGTWSLAGGVLSCESAAYSTFQLPYTPPEEYDLSVSFTRNEGASQVALLLAARGRAFDFALDVRGHARFERVNDMVGGSTNPTDVPVAISNGRRYTLTVQIRKDAIRALLDGKLLTEYKPDPDFKDLTRYNVWKIPDTHLCAIGAHNAKVTFHSIELVEIAGKGKPTR